MVERSGNLLTKEKLNIITPSCRPENLKHLYDGVISGANYFDLHWYIMLDSFHCENTYPAYTLLANTDDVDIQIVEVNDPNSVSGNGQRNAGLDLIDDGYVWFLDDDNIIHENFFSVMSTILTQKFNGVIFAQQLETFVRSAHSGMVKETHIDQAQYLLHRDYIGENRFVQKYTADGEFIERLYKNNPSGFLFTNSILCYYNRLKWKDMQGV